MGVDSKLYVSTRWNIADVRDVLQNRLEVKVKTRFHEHTPDYVTLDFKAPSGDERTLHIFTNSSVGGLNAMSMHMRDNEEARMILRTLAATFGGMFQPKDTVEDFEAHHPTSEGNVDFIVNEAIKSNPKLGNDAKGMAEFLSKEKWK